MVLFALCLAHVSRLPGHAHLPSMPWGLEPGTGVSRTAVHAVLHTVCKCMDRGTVRFWYIGRPLLQAIRVGLWVFRGAFALLPVLPWHA